MRALVATASPDEAARALRDTRLLAAVVAVLDSADDSGGEKDSHMALVSMVNGAGQRGLLAFSGVDSLAAWDARARPVPASGRDLARSAMEDGASAVIVDVAGPHRLALEGRALGILADRLDLEQVGSRVAALLDGCDARVLDARGQGLGADVLVEVGETDQASLSAMAAALAGDGELARLVPAGLALSPGRRLGGATGRW